MPRHSLSPILRPSKRKRKSLRAKMRLQYNALSSDVSVKLDTFFQKKNCMVQVDPGRVIMPRKYDEIGEAILDFKVRPDDIWLVSYPRTGSTWAQELIWLLGNDLDFEGAKRLQVTRSPLLELSAIFSEDHNDWLTSKVGDSVSVAARMPSPRYIKSHLPLPLLPTELSVVQPKIIYTARNPKDLCVSYFHYCRLVHDMQGSFEEFCEIFLEGNAPIGSAISHNLDFWYMRDEPNVLFLKYEDMKRDFPDTIRTVADFLDLKRPLTDEDLDRLCDYLRFDTMQKNPAVNLEPIICGQNGGKENEKKASTFIRKGQIGDWRNYMNETLSTRFDEWIRKGYAGSGLEFDYE